MLQATKRRRPGTHDDQLPLVHLHHVVYFHGALDDEGRQVLHVHPAVDVLLQL